MAHKNENANTETERLKSNSCFYPLVEAMALFPGRTGSFELKRSFKAYVAESFPSRQPRVMSCLLVLQSIT